jgi:hypothetical protein
MLTLCKSTVLGAAFLAGVAIAAGADPLCSTPTGPCQAPGPQIAAPTPSNAVPAPESVTLPEVTVFAPYSSRGVGPRVSSFGTIQLPPRRMSRCTPTQAASARASTGLRHRVEFLPRSITISAL